MSAILEELQTQAKQLDEKERAQLAHFLLDTLKNEEHSCFHVVETPYSVSVFRKLITILSIVGRYLRWIFYLIALLIGLMVAGPFLSSTEYILLTDQVTANPLLGYLLDPEGWIIDQLIRNLAVYFAVYTCAFSAYGMFRERMNELNEYLGYVSFLTRGVGTFLISLFMLLVGIGGHQILVLDETGSTIQLLAIAFFLFGLPGLLLSCYAQLTFKKNPLTDAVAPYAAVMCGLLTFAAMIYGATADAVGLLIRLT